jgi:hypothetical protein
MKKILCLLLVLPLSGCLYQKVSQVEILAAQEACGTLNGVRHIQSWGTGAIDVRCNNGEHVTWNRLVGVIDTLEPSYIKKETK